MSFTLNNPFQYWNNPNDGRPVGLGKLYVGLPDTDPKNAANQVPLLKVNIDGTESLITQPVQLLAGGIPAVNGTPVQLKINAETVSIEALAENDASIGLYTARWSVPSLGMVSRQELAAPNSAVVIAGMTAEAIVEKLGKQFKTVADYGAVGDGIADDTGAINAAFADTSYVVVPDGFKLRITNTIVMPRHSTFLFQGGIGNTNNQLPTSYIVKSNTMTTSAVIMQECCQFIGGGIVGQVGNTGPGIEVRGNSVYIDRPLITRMGGTNGDGIRIGTSDVYVNCNSAYLNKPVCCYNGGQGIHVHDGVSEATGSADANAGTMIQPFCFGNGGSGILMKRAWWWTIVNALTEINQGWGLFVDSTVVAPDTVPRCRYLQVVGGDFNEGNAGGSCFFGGYACSMYMSTTNQQIQTGGVFNNVFGGAGDSVNWGQTINRFLTLNANQGDGTTYPMNITKTISGTAGDGAGIVFQMGTTNETQPYPERGSYSMEYRSPGHYQAVIRAYKGTEMVRGLVVDPEFRRWLPGSDNQWALGTTNVRFNGVYAIIPVYANDAAAIAGGMTRGGFYHNGDGIVRMVR